MSVTIDSLDIQIRSSAGSAKEKIEELAKALDSLSGMESVKRIINALNKLPAPAEKSANAIKKLDSVNRSAANSSEKHSKALSKQSMSLLATYEHLSNVFSMMHGLQDAASKVLNDAVQWDGIQFRFGRAFGEDAEMVLEYAEKVSKELRINQQMFMQYSSMYGSLLSGFGMAQEQVTTISVGLTELSYDIWAAYNDRYKTLEDASEAVRSAITGEIEPIRNAGIALTEASMQEYLDSIGMASTSVEKLTEAQKSELRYAVMVNAAMQQGIVGTYAREMDTAEGAIRSLTQQFKTLGQAIGSLFIPLLQKAIPWITAFVELATDAVIAIGELFGIEFQKISWGDSTGMKQTAEGANATADALGDAAKNAKKMMDYTMGFDELNVINPPSDSGAGSTGGAGAGGGGSLGLDLDTLWNKSVFAEASKQVDKLKQKIKDLFVEWRVEIEAFGAGTMLITLGNIVEKLKEAEFFSGGFFKNMNTISKIGLTAIVITLQWILMDEALENFIEEGSWDEYIKAAVEAAIGTWVLYKAWGATGLVVGLGVTAAVSLSATFEDGSIDSVEEAVTGLSGLAAGAAAISFALKKLPKDKSWVGGLVSGLSLLFKKKISLGAFLSGMFPNAAKVVSAATGWITQTLLPGIGAALSKVLPSFLTKLPGTIAKAVTAIPGWGWIVGAIVAALGLAIVDYDFTDLGHKFGNAIGSLFKNLHKFCTDIGSAIQEWWDSLPWDEPVIPFMIEFGGRVVDGLWEGIKNGWNNFWGNIKEFIGGFVDGWREGLGIHSPSTVFAEIGGYILEGLLNGISEGWKKLKQWFNETVMPKFTLEYWKGKFDVIRQAVSSKLGEVKQAAINKWTEIKTWFSDNVAPKFTLTFWLDKFKNLKEGFTQTIKNAVNAGIDLMNKFIGWLNEKLNFSWDGLTLMGKEVFPGGSIQLFTIPPIPRLENGGFLEDGLFTMNHGEIAGKFNNGKSVVANNQQIVEGIAAGVYEAVVSAMNATSGRGQSVNVYLDGRQITAAVEKRQSERGRSIMGNQLGYAY